MSIIYGVDCFWDFDKFVYFFVKFFLVDDCLKCKDLFSCFVKEDEVVWLGYIVKKMYIFFYVNDI